MKRFLCLVFLLLIQVANYGQTLTMGADYSTQIFYPLVSQIFEDAGITTELVLQPGGRSIVSANYGLLDGEIWRVIDIGEKYPNLIPVPTPLMVVNFYAWYNYKTFSMSDNDEIPYARIGLIRGTKAVEEYVKDFDTEITYAIDADNLIKLLERDRIDIAIHGDSGFQYATDSNPDIVSFPTPVISKPVHIWLNERHVDLIPVLESVISDWGDIRISDAIAEIMIKQHKENQANER